MKENTFYFPHDYQARDDEDMIDFIQEYGVAGYGAYWIIVERLHESETSKIKVSSIQGIAKKEGIDHSLLANVVESHLFKREGEYFFSERVFRNKEEREEKRNKKAEAGRLGGIQSGEVRRSKTKQCFEANEANEPKERKGKEIKEKETTIIQRDIFEIEKDQNFQTVWKEFVEYRKKKKSLSDIAIVKTLKKLDGYGVEIAIKALEETMSNDWQGIFPERIQTNKPKENPNYKPPIIYNSKI